MKRLLVRFRNIKSHVDFTIGIVSTPDTPVELARWEDDGGRILDMVDNGYSIKDDSWL